MEIFDDSMIDDSFPWVRIVGAGKFGASALTFFDDFNVDDGGWLDTLAVRDKNFSREKIFDFVAGCDWLFVITDVEDLEVAEAFVKSIEGSKLLITFLILCPSADDARLADIPDSFGTWIILPEDKIAESGLTKNAAIYRVVDMTVGIIPLMKKGLNFIGMDFADVVATIGNVGRACIGFGESFDHEKAALAAMKKALKSPLFIEEIRKAKKALLVFVGKVEFLNMMEINEAATFLDELRQADWEDITLWQVDADEPFDKDSVAAFVLATDFDE